MMNFWIQSVKMFCAIGFELTSIETLGYSANSVVQDNRKNGLKTDFIITYTKPVAKIKKSSIDVVDLMDFPDILSKINSLKNLGFAPYKIMNIVISDIIKQK